MYHQVKAVNTLILTIWTHDNIILKIKNFISSGIAFGFGWYFIFLISLVMFVVSHLFFSVLTTESTVQQIYKLEDNCIFQLPGVAHILQIKNSTSTASQL
jgi:hypothetical protein